MRTIQIFGNGSATTGNNASLTPNVSSDVLVGDLVCILAAIRTGSPRTPAGWTTLAQSGNVALMGRYWRRGDSMPTVTFTGGAAGDDTMVRSFAMRNVPNDITRVINAVAIQSNASAQDIAVPAVTSTVDGCLILDMVYKADDYTSLSRSGYFFAVSLSSTVGNDASAGIMGKFQTSAGTEAGGTVTVSGGANAVSIAISMAIAPFETTYVSIPDSARPCDYAAAFTTGSDAACAAMSSIDSGVAALKNPPTISISAERGSATANNLVSYSSVDIDPTGVADLVADPYSFTLPTGRWFTGWAMHIATTVTFNLLYGGDGSDGTIQNSVADLDTTLRYPEDDNHDAGGGSFSAATMRQISIGNTRKISTYANYQGTVPGSGSPEVTILSSVQYAFRISDS